MSDVETTPVTGATPSAEPQDSPAGDTQGKGTDLTSRRSFLGGAGRKALYITPGILTLTAQQAMASGFVCGSALKHTVGSPCATDGSQKDCCPIDMNNNALRCSVTTMLCENY